MNSSSSEDEAFIFSEVEGEGVKFTLQEENPHSKAIGAGFFDSSYTVAGSTGNSVWEGCWVMMEFLKKSNLKEEFVGNKIVELGSGTGLLGLYLSALGAHMLCTDLPTVVTGIMNTNVTSNSKELDVQNKGWNSARSVGLNGGSIATMPIDWTVDLANQVTTNDPRDADFVIAVETVWLKELIKPFVTTFKSLLKKDKAGYFAFLDRSKETSTTFASTSELFGEFTAQNCVFTVLHTQPAPKTVGKTVYVYEVKLQ
eukprot:TRINITY_DN7863_c0_g1_i1.p1 TRINITY_DN7863_c0_g1~~TRINITY_DN7863_c0_g1_i1.p1  ORF type:complete len:263 (-),score=52.91 TRINITY_DN7863_c0_g1_i1:36-803(-)